MKKLESYYKKVIINSDLLANQIILIECPLVGSIMLFCRFSQHGARETRRFGLQLYSFVRKPG
jgi:hypothetical protein